MPPLRTSSQSKPAHFASTQRKPWGWWLLCVSLCMATSLWALPAAVMAWAVQQASAARLHLADPQGSLWQGSAMLLIANGQPDQGTGMRRNDDVQTSHAQQGKANGSDASSAVDSLSAGRGDNAAAQIARAVPGRLQWRFSMVGWRMLRLTLLLDCCMQRPAQLDVGWRGRGFELELQLPGVRLPLALLEGLGTPWDTLRLGGEVLLTVSRMEWQASQGQQWHGSASASVQRMHSALSTVRPLGDYVLNFNSAGGLPTITVSSLAASALQVQGHITLVDGRLQADLVAHANAGYENQLTGLLQILGRRDGPVSRIRF